MKKKDAFIFMLIWLVASILENISTQVGVTSIAVEGTIRTLLDLISITAFILMVICLIWGKKAKKDDITDRKT